MSSEIYHLDFDFGGNNKVYNASVFIDVNKLELLRGAKTYEEIKRVVSYMINELLDGNLTAITRANDNITIKYSGVVNSLVGLIILDNQELMEYFPGGNFQYKVNSLKKINLH